MTVKLTVFSAIGSLIWGTLLAAMRVSPVPLMRGFGTVYVNVVRNIPLTVIIVFTSLGLADIFRVTMGAGNDVKLTAFRLAILGFVAYTAAFVCEALRSGINTVPVGQVEAARALGMTFVQVLSNVVLPQAFRTVVPPLVSVLNAMLKNTTVAAGFSVAEAGAITFYLSERGENQIYGLLWITIGFLILVVPLVTMQRMLERRWKVAR